MNTTLATHPKPIYTQPVNGSSLSECDQNFNYVVTVIRQLLANGPSAEHGRRDLRAGIMERDLPARDVLERRIEKSTWLAGVLLFTIEESMGGWWKVDYRWTTSR